MDSATASDAEPMVKGNKSSESEEEMVIKYFTPIWRERESYNPLSFYMSSTVYHPGPISAVNKLFQSKRTKVSKNYIPLSYFTGGSTVYCKSSQSKTSGVVYNSGSKCKGNKSSESESKISKNYINGSSANGNKSSESKMVANEKKISKNCIMVSSANANKSSESKVCRNSIPK